MVYKSNKPSREEIQARIRTMLLEDLTKDEPRGWYFVSVANNSGLLGGVFVKAMGHTDAWNLLHHLGWYPKGSEAETQTANITDDFMEENVPEDMRWRFLNREEVFSIAGMEKREE